MSAGTELKKLRSSLGMTRAAFSTFTAIPLRTLEDWEAEKRNPPNWLLGLLSCYIDCYKAFNKYFG